MFTSFDLFKWALNACKSGWGENQLTNFWKHGSDTTTSFAKWEIQIYIKENEI